MAMMFKNSTNSRLYAGTKQSISRSWSWNSVCRHQNPPQLMRRFFLEWAKHFIKMIWTTLPFFCKWGNRGIERSVFSRMTQKVRTAENKSSWHPVQSSTRYAILPPAGRENRMEKCLILITSGGCPHADQALDESECLKPWNHLSCTDWHGFAWLSNTFSQGSYCFELQCFSLFSSWRSAIFLKAFKYLLTRSLHVLRHSHLCFRWEQNLMAFGS